MISRYVGEIPKENQLLIYRYRRESENPILASYLLELSRTSLEFGISKGTS
jgi:hypothetical protein